MEQTEPKLLRELADILVACGIEDAALEAKWICEDAADEAQARSIAVRRAQHEPLQYLLGKWDFYGLPVTIGEGVLIPRADTETLVDAVLSRRGSLPEKPLSADLCTGSGCIALALKQHIPEMTVTGIDKSTQALAYAKRNAALNRLDVQWVCGDVLTPEPALTGLDLIVCNPPYLTQEEMLYLQREVQFEPQEALLGGADGLDFYRRITAVWRDALKRGGMLVYEVGYTQAAAVEEILAKNSFEQIERIRDLNGIERVVLGYRND